MQAESIGFTFRLLRCCQGSHALLGLLEVLDAFVNFCHEIFLCFDSLPLVLGIEGYGDTSIIGMMHMWSNFTIPNP